MAERVAYRLVARSPFHLGERGVGIEESSVILHADTLFAALCLTLRELGEDLAALMERYPSVRLPAAGPPEFSPGAIPPPFRLTSAFPYASDVYLFPRPMVRPVGLKEATDPGLSKTLKKIRYVSKPIFEALLAGNSVARYLIGNEVLLQGGQVWVTSDELEALQVQAGAGRRARIWEKGAAPRVTVDRVTNRSQVYAAGRVRFVEGSGLFCLVEYGDTSWRPRVERGLRALGDSGVGGERSSGHGQFDLSIVAGFAVTEMAAGQATGWCTLAPYWPTEAEVTAGVLDGASYGLLNRRGWLGSPDGMNLRRRGVRMLAEGSVTQQEPRGALADVKPLDPAPAINVPHDVWRYGLAFALRCRAVADEEGTR